MKEILEFLEKQGMKVNDFNVYSYVSKDGTQIVNLAELLDSYKEYLIEKINKK